MHTTVNTSQRIRLERRHCEGPCTFQLDVNYRKREMYRSVAESRHDVGGAEAAPPPADAPQSWARRFGGRHHHCCHVVCHPCIRGSGGGSTLQISNVRQRVGMHSVRRPFGCN